MQFVIELERILEEYLTKTAHTFWDKITESNLIPNRVWLQPTSSSGKYHNKEGGFVPTIAEHTCEMLRGAVKCMRMFDITKKTSKCDVLLLGIVLHDAYKRGLDGKGKWTHSKHEDLIADKILDGKNAFLKFLSPEEVTILIDIVRFHSGRWSPASKKGRYEKGDFDFSNHHPYVLFIHSLDMLSSKNCLRLILGDS